jgi:ubiquinone/menaquinone biosynthesis C-methylase UbiE
MIVLDIGCGKCKYKSKNPNDKVIGLDYRKNTMADIVCDVDEGIPLPDNYVDKVVAIHSLEHTKDLVKVMNEIWRVCKPNAEVFINCPYFSSPGTFDDPTHHRFITYKTFEYFTKDFKYEHHTDKYFKITSRRIMFFGENLPPHLKWLQPIEKIINPVINRIPVFYQSYLSYILPSREIHITLKPEKGELR